MNITILGKSIELKTILQSKLKGITVGDSLEYMFYQGVFKEVEMIFIKPKRCNPSPRTCMLASERLSRLFDKPIVFILNSGPTYERQRLLDKNVYFVMGDKFAYLPMLVANERIRKNAPAKRLSPVAQFILLYHLQVESIEGLSAKNMAEKFPYSYESVALGLTCLADLGLAEKVSKDSKSKIIRFTSKGKDLWDKAQPFLIDPVKERLYCDKLISNNLFPVCGINALAHYSRLNPEDTLMIMLSRTQLQSLMKNEVFLNINKFDGNVAIEIWKYPAVSKRGETCKWVDKLSLVLSLRKDDDARVENEAERIINETKWLD